ncbi:MAG: hypothetical protein FI707_04230 [SAR202 cluster bacterium]|jgi:hypothetical protein|nr:hypothetical protein [Acidobacteriota bacterium]MDP6371530.1 hypothetical protein [Vicinamibacterales bacterium]MQG56386.1 hypothetical protein [SAR202 cluster bacterium]MQG67979.1 hypothetical protein [SAR202 cluster bacterium]HAK57202.1 hypothetical protein [Acidobacteriota bacterium]|tara:strand:- start:33442 stop:33846 length:405 start_codon:yes stop_codon:yes gene_type:complete
MFKNLRRCVVGPCATGGAIALLTLLQAGCGGDTVTESGTDQIGIEVSTLRVTIENRSGLGLRNVRAVIEPAGIQKTGYTALVGEVGSAQRRPISLGDFRAEDGTPFSARAVQPSAVRVTAVDMNGQQYEAVVPW